MKKIKPALGECFYPYLEKKNIYFPLRSFNFKIEIFSDISSAMIGKFSIQIIKTNMVLEN